MSIKLDFSICQNSDCKSIKFSETTCSYSSNNTGGWGSPNEEVTDATEATLQIQIPGVVGLVNIDLYSLGYPTNISNSLTLTSNNLGLGVNYPLPDGIYIFTYSVTTSNDIYTITKYILLDCQVRCCVSKMLAEIPDKDCDCANETSKKALLAYTYLEALTNAARCGNITKANNILNLLRMICNKKSCGCK
jgi:hypothetical protein